MKKRHFDELAYILVCLGTLGIAYLIRVIISMAIREADK